MALINPINKVSSAKAAPSPEASAAEQDKAFTKALGSLSQNLAAGNLTAAKQDYVQLQKAQTANESRQGEPKAAVTQVKKQVNDLGAAFRSNDIKAAEKAATTLKKGVLQQTETRKVVDKAITLKKSQKDAASFGGNGLGSDSVRSLFNAVA